MYDLVQFHLVTLSQWFIFYAVVAYVVCGRGCKMWIRYGQRNSAAIYVIGCAEGLEKCVDSVRGVVNRKIDDNTIIRKCVRQSLNKWTREKVQHPSMQTNTSIYGLQFSLQSCKAQNCHHQQPWPEKDRGAGKKVRVKCECHINNIRLWKCKRRISIEFLSQQYYIQLVLTIIICYLKDNMFQKYQN